MGNTRWDTDAYRKRIASLNRVDLHQLYPSESWSLYRSLIGTTSALDLGCGNGAKSSIIKKLDDRISYTGVDLSDSVISDAKSLFADSIFFAQDVFDFLQTNDFTYDVVMSWSVIKSIINWRLFLDGMIQSASKYVLFDARFFDINISEPVFDLNIYKAEYGGEETPLMFSSYKPIVEYLKTHDKVKEIQLAAYQSAPDPHSKYLGQSIPFSYIFSFFVSVGYRRDQDKQAMIYEQLPIGLR